MAMASYRRQELKGKALLYAFMPNIYGMKYGLIE